MVTDLYCFIVKLILNIFATVSTAFFFSTWETYYTGTLYLGVVNGPTEGLLIAVGSLMISAFYGPKFWWQRVGSVVSFVELPTSVADLRLVELSLAGMIALLVITQVPVSIIRAIQACNAKQRSVVQALLNTLPYIVLNLAILAWITTPTSVAISQSGILLVCTWGFAFGRIVAKIVLSHVTHTDYPSYWLTILPFIVGALISRSPELFGT
eukprot:jgi/Hompol1/3050/HPOL_006314-RA